MTAIDGLWPGESMISLLSSTFGLYGEPPGAFAVQAGRGCQSVLGSGDLVGDEPRLLIDFTEGRPLLSVRGEQVGERRKNTVRLWGQEYHIHRSRFRQKLHFAVTVGERTVLRAREHSNPKATVRTLRTDSDPALDPVVTLALLLLTARPDKMGFLNELFRN
ncbi:hypothetical protein [Streptosporangium sp. NPDC000396]|uniref:hypothetical protein n=1 Tax=Streptosporangium sp. NPDC000396 TaxID=3366185 RepID=UPI0036C6A7E7